MKKLLLFALLVPTLALACSKHDSYDAWLKKGLIKTEKTAVYRVMLKN